MDVATEAAANATSTDPTRHNYGLSQEEELSISEFLDETFPDTRTPIATSVDSSKCISAALFHALPCQAKCGVALMAVRSACGGLLPRAGRWRHDAPDAAATVCINAVSDAHVTCGASGRACQSILEATPLRDSAFLATRPARFAQEHNQNRAKMGEAPEPPPPPPTDHLEWNDQHVWGVLSPELCFDTSLEVDVRGNNLLGRLPSCLWEHAKSGGTVLVSRNRFAGIMPPLADGVVAVHAGFNAMEGDVSDIFGPAVKQGLVQLTVNHNKFTSRNGLAGLAATKASNLVDLDLSNNRLGPEGSVDLAAHLAAFPALQHYDISANRFDVAAAAATAAVGVSFTTVHAQVTLPSSSAMWQMCSACSNFEQDIRQDKYIAHAAIMNCMRSNGCARPANGISVTAALVCALQAVLNPGLIVDITKQHTAGTAAWNAGDAGDNDDIDEPQESFHAALNVASGWHVELVEAVQQHEAEGDGFVIGYTLTPVDHSSDDPTNWALSSVADRITDALDRLQHRRHGHLNPAADHCAGAAADGVHDGADERAATAAASTTALLESVLLDVRGGCPTGRMGPRCNYLCAAEWHRTARPAAAIDGHSIISGADLNDAHPSLGLHTPAKSIPYEVPPSNTSHQARPHETGSHALITRIDPTDAGGNIDASTDANCDAHPDAFAPVSEFGNSQNTVQCSRHDAARGHCHYMGGSDGHDPIYRHNWIGEPHEQRLTMSAELKECTSACRGHANKAVVDCQLWMVEKTHKAYHKECRLSLRDMTKMCGLHASGDYHGACLAHESKKFSRIAHPDREHDSGCEVCGIVHYLEQHGLSDNDHEGITGGSSNSRYRKHVHVAFEDTEYIKSNAAVIARYDASDFQPDFAWMASHRAHGSDVEGITDAHKKALLGPAAIARLGMDVDSRPMTVDNPDLNLDLVREHEAFERDDTHEQSHMFPICSAHMGCSHPCYTHVERIVMRRCMHWLRAGGISARTSCMESLMQVSQVCAAEEISLCAEPVTASFTALLL